ncbi:epoxyqueuosine reductase [Sulfurimicrobium lacus]|uniref:Epoxyqueuosine reductase n=1 Tax=Sulfurimicrobium lacus TaxID=2715678 RepID=A0A6F8VA78_9PROT|nr:epoxyqueuosine reductase [Sulfurimicrobium lacus]
MQGLLTDYGALSEKIKSWGKTLGFQAVAISAPDLSKAETRLLEWLEQDMHGEMDYMASHGMKRSRPAELVPGTLTVISARMDYLPPDAHDSLEILASPTKAFISRYALGRDYHKILRARLQKLSDKIREEIGPFGYRVFSDSAPVMEVELAAQAGLGWRGKHSMLLSREHGSWFFLGEIYTDLPLPLDPPQGAHCGTCSRCIEACPTQAIIAPYRVDARRCISYLTIEHKGSIPLPLRSLMGNRIYGCDDCQLVCPWNRIAQTSTEKDFEVRHSLDSMDLTTLLAWSEEEFRVKTAGSAIHRIGHERWLRNIAVALGNAPTTKIIIEALKKLDNHNSLLVREHVTWALAQHGQSCDDCRT